MENKKIDRQLERKITELIRLAKELKLIVSSDEEFNTLYGKFDISYDPDLRRPIIFGYSTTELDL